MANYISIDQIEEGMILAEPVVNKFGNVLLGAGASLSSNHITLFKTWNVKDIAIRSLSSDSEIEITEEHRAQAAVLLTKRMKWFPRNDIEKDLYSLALLVTAQNILDKSQDNINGHNQNNSSGS